RKSGSHAIRRRAIRPLRLIPAFAGRIDTGNVGGLIFVVDPQAAHRVVHGGEDFHGLFARVYAYELFVNFENAFELFVEDVGGNMRNVEIDGGLAGQSHFHFEDAFVNGARSYVARH